MKINFLTNFFLLSLNIFHNLCTEIKKFESDSIEYYDQILVLPEENRIYVGAKNYLLEFDINGIDKLLNKILIEPKIETSSLCKIKGQPIELCENFVKVLFTYNKNLVDLNKIKVLTNLTPKFEKVLFYCGTNAFKPICKEISLKNLTNVLNTIDGISKCPFSPKHDFTLQHSNEFIYYGGPTDLLAQNSIFIRDQLDQKNHYIKTYIDDSKMLYSDAKFIYSFETEFFVYFLFIETAVENLFCNKKLTSRIGRVCKNDPGFVSNTGTYWNSFLKAKISCLSPKKTNKTFYFDEIINAQFIETESKLLIFFKNSDSEYFNKSLICVYNLADIESKFDNKFKIQKDSLSIWTLYEDSIASVQFKCNFNNQMKNLNNFQKKYQIINDEIYSSLDKPIFESFKYINKNFLFDEIEDLNSSKKNYLVFLVKETKINKFLYQPDSDKFCLVDFVSLNSNEKDEVLKLNLNNFTKKIYIGLVNKILEIKISSCENYVSKEDCLVIKKDPYCIWDEEVKKCFHINDISKSNLKKNLEQANFKQMCEKDSINIESFFISLWPTRYSQSQIEVIKEVPKEIIKEVETVKYVPQETIKYVEKNCERFPQYWTECGAECGIGLRFKSINETHTISKYCVKQNDCIDGMIWSSWSNCVNGTKKKTRICHEKNCPLVEVEKNCTDFEKKISHSSFLGYLHNNRHIMVIIFFSILGFILGLIFGLKISNLYNKTQFSKKFDRDLPLNSQAIPLIKPLQNDYVIDDNILNVESNVPCNFEVKENSFLIYTDSNQLKNNCSPEIKKTSSKEKR